MVIRGASPKSQAHKAQSCGSSRVTVIFFLRSQASALRSSSFSTPAKQRFCIHGCQRRFGMGFLSRAKVWQAPYRVLRPCICICRNACDVVSSREQSWRCHAIDGLAAFPRQLLRAPSPSGRPTTCVVVVDTTHLPLPATPPGSGLGHEGRGPKL